MRTRLPKKKMTECRRQKFLLVVLDLQRKNPGIFIADFAGYMRNNTVYCVLRRGKEVAECGDIR